MAKIHYKVSLPFSLCRASGTDKDAFDFIYDQRLLGLKTVREGDDIVVLGTDNALAPSLDDIIGAVAKGGSFEGIRVCGVLKDNEFKSEVPIGFPGRLITVDEVERVKTWDEWLESSGMTPHVSLDGKEKTFKLVYAGKYLDSKQLVSILNTTTVISSKEHADLKDSVEYLKAEK